MINLPVTATDGDQIFSINCTYVFFKKFLNLLNFFSGYPLLKIFKVSAMKIHMKYIEAMSNRFSITVEKIQMLAGCLFNPLHPALHAQVAGGIFQDTLCTPKFIKRNFLKNITYNIICKFWTVSIKIYYTH